MSQYQKTIAYLDYLEDGMKIRNAGFVRVEKNNGRVRLEMRVKDIPESFGGQYELKADNGGTIGRISLNRGCGSCCVVWSEGGEVPQGKQRTRSNSIYIRFPGRCLLQAVWPAEMELLTETGEISEAANKQNREYAEKRQGEESGLKKKKEAEEAQREEKTPNLRTREDEARGNARSAGEEKGDTKNPGGEQPGEGRRQVPEAVPGREAGMPGEGTGTPEAVPVGMPEAMPKREAGIPGEGIEMPEAIPSEMSEAVPGREAGMPDEGTGTPEAVPVGMPEAMPKREAGASEENEEAKERCRRAGEADRGGNEQDAEKARRASPVHDAQEPVCYGDKWEQLSHMYLQIHPFRDGRAYLSIAPKDFVVLRQEYQKMVHNSFLLHGYYNYRHLILGRIKHENEYRYYLGVPGNFYNREKMVAEMFGFEAFEGEREPAKAGDFGYFMKRVEI